MLFINLGAKGKVYGAPHGSPFVLKYPYCHEITTETHRTGDRRVLENVHCSKIFQRVFGCLMSP